MKRILQPLFKALPLSVLRSGLWLANAKFNVGVVGVLFDPEGKVLLLRHVYRKSQPWGLPAGFANAGEEPDAAFLRELREETNLTARIDGILTVQLVHRQHVEVVFHGRLDSISGAEADSREIEDIAVFYPDACPPETHPSQRDLINLALARKLHE